MLVQNINFTLADKATARRLITTEDVYTRNLSAYDLELRGITPPTHERYLELAADSVEDFTPDDISDMEESLAFLAENLDYQGIHLPPIGEVTLVKTNMRGYEENAAGYTRGKTIFLFSDWVESEYTGEVASLICHELFHVLSRNCPEFRKSMYDIIGFTIMDHDVPVPELDNLAFVSNPDVVHHDSYIEIPINGKKERGMIMTFGKLPLPKDTNLFRMLIPHLLVLDANGQPNGVFYNVHRNDEIMKTLETRMGDENIYFLVDPEECMASHFVAAVFERDLRHNVRVNKMRKRLKSVNVG